MVRIQDGTDNIPSADSSFNRNCPQSRQEAFLQVLIRNGVQATLRREKGGDIDAACGQLRLKEETAAGMVSAPS